MPKIPGYSGRTTSPTTSQATRRMGTEFIMTEDDARPENASVLEDALELSLLTIEPGAGPVDVSQDSYPGDL